jgi:hypothetical protein
LADVIDGEILLAQGDNLLPEALLLGGGVGTFGRREEEGPLRVVAELVGQDAEAAGRIAAATGGLGRGEAFDEIGAEGFVLAVGGILGLEEEAGEGCYRF